MNYQVGMISLGCSKNQVDAERMLSLLSENGFTICSDPARCDAIIVNTLPASSRTPSVNPSRASSRPPNRKKGVSRSLL